MVIAQDTEYVLLDEPTNNLDIYHAANLMKIVKKICVMNWEKQLLWYSMKSIRSFYSDYICAFKEAG